MPKVNPRTRLILIVGLAALGVFVLGAFLFHKTLWEWEQQTIDIRFRLRGSIPVHPSIAHIDINDESLTALGGWPWKRSLHGELIRSLNEKGASAKLFDIIFRSEQEPKEDQALIAAIQETGRSYMPVGFELLPFSGLGLIGCPENAEIPETGDPLEGIRLSVGEAKGHPEPFYTCNILNPMPVLLKAAKGVGHISGTPDSDGVFRRVPLVISHRGRLIPSLSFAAILGALDLKPAQIEIEFGRAILLHEVQLPGTTNRTTIEIPINQRGEIIVNFAGPWQDAFPSYSASDLLMGSPEQQSVLKGKLHQCFCIIALSASGVTDFGITPFETSSLLNRIHSYILNTILTQQFLIELPGWVHGLIVLMVVGILLALGSILRPPLFVLVGLALLGGYIGVVYGMFALWGVLVPLVQPGLAGGLTVASCVIAVSWVEAKDRRRVESAFTQYLSPELLKQAMEKPEMLSLGGKRKELSVLFSDIVGFTTLSESIEPEAIQALLNDYFDEMTRIVFEHQGTIDKFIGDALMAMWGDPLPCENHALQAVRCAIAMQKRQRELQAEWQSKGRSSFKIRIGVNSGWMTVGNMGSKRRMSYTVIGSQVNLAQRLESKAEHGGILIGPQTYALVSGQVPTEDIGEIQVKGVAQPIRAYKVPC